MPSFNPASTAFIFPGRKALSGRFSPADLAEVSHIAYQTFSYADEVLGEVFSHTLFTADRGAFALPRAWHLALYLSQVALLRIFYESFEQPFEPRVVIGVGSGEVTALMAAGALSFEDALTILVIRARMIAGVEGEKPLAESLFTSLPRPDLDAALSASGAAMIAVTSVISPRGHGVSGESSALESVTSSLATLAYAPQPLPSLEGSHLLDASVPAFADALRAVPFHKGMLRVIASTSGKPCHRPDDLRALLVSGLSEPVRYDLLLPALRDHGITDIVSFGADLCLNTGAMASGIRYTSVETMSDILRAVRGRPFG